MNWARDVWNQKPCRWLYDYRVWPLAFIPVGKGELELIQPLDPKVIATQGEGIHHIAVITDNIEADIERIKELGVEIDEKPRMGAHEVKIAFTHDIHGVSIELCQEPGQRIY